MDGEMKARWNDRAGDKMKCENGNGANYIHG
jgi:hypothetical protein